MIGYYVHHVGSGHRHRAGVLAERLHRDGVEVTGLSSLPRPADWTGDWVELPHDDDGTTHDVTARGHLHWAPLRHDGARSRAATISAWIESARPELVVVDVSVEVLLLARLHGIPAVAVVLPGRRDDGVHTLGLGVAEALVGFWPEEATGMSLGLPDDLRERLVAVGALSRHPVQGHSVRPPVARTDRRSVVLMLGSGGHEVTDDDVSRARASTPGWDWTVLGPGSWVDDPSELLASADVVVTHAGQNAVAETAAARRPAVVLPQPRPHSEQETTGTQLASGWPALVCPTWPEAGWSQVLEDAAALDPARWETWCDGRAADRFADVVRTTLARVGAVTPT